MHQQTVYLSLGSNLGDSREHLHKASASIIALPGLTLLQASPIYRTSPQEVQDQPDFFNQVLSLQCTAIWTPETLWQALAKIEKDLGRVRIPTQQFGPRVIDIDVLLFGTHIYNTETLILPHPRMYKRAFVLVPLADIAPDVPIPFEGTFSTAKILLSKLSYSMIDECLLQNPSP